MAYDLVKQKFPGSPTAVGARIRHRMTERQGSILPPRAGEAGVRVRFDGEFMPQSCDPRQIEYLDPAPQASPEWRAC